MSQVANIERRESGPDAQDKTGEHGYRATRLRDELEDAVYRFPLAHRHMFHRSQQRTGGQWISQWATMAEAFAEMLNPEAGADDIEFMTTMLRIARKGDVDAQVQVARLIDRFVDRELKS